MPRIGLNLLYLRPGVVGGGETYARGLIEALRKVEFEGEFILFVNETAYASFADIERDPRFTRVCCHSPLGPIRRHLWEQLRFGQLCKTYKIDILHSLANVAPIFASVKQIVTIHDLIYLRTPERLGWMKRLFLQSMIPASARACQIVITVSEYSRSDLATKLGIRENKLLVTLEGPGQDWGEITSFAELQRKYEIPEKYYLAVGTGVQKRIEHTVEAVRTLRERGTDAHLVVAGYHDRKFDHLKSQDLVTIPGYVPAGDLAGMFQNAIALVMFSEMEGFGIPVLEAMQLGTPVISSDQGALKEVVGSGGLLVPQDDREALVDAMLRVANDQTLANDLRQRGTERVAAFSWKHCAEQTISAYSACLHSPRTETTPTVP